MDIRQSYLFFIVSVLTALFIIMQIRKNRLNIEDSIVWILWIILLLIFGLFPKLVFKFSDLFGFVSTSNFVLCLFILFSYFIIFFQSIKISQLKEKNTRLIQKISLFEREVRDKLNKK